MHTFSVYNSGVRMWYITKPTDKLNLIVSLNVWHPCKWFTFHCYVVMCCILTTVQQFSTTSGPHWNVSYTLIKTACVVHYRSAVRSRLHWSLTDTNRCITSNPQVDRGLRMRHRVGFIRREAIIRGAPVRGWISRGECPTFGFHACWQYTEAGAWSELKCWHGQCRKVAYSV